MNTFQTYDYNVNRVPIVLHSGGDYSEAPNIKSMIKSLKARIPFIERSSNVIPQQMEGGGKVTEYKKQYPVIGGGNVDYKEQEERHGNKIKIEFEHPNYKKKSKKEKKNEKSDQAYDELDHLLDKNPLETYTV